MNKSPSLINPRNELETYEKTLVNVLMSEAGSIKMTGMPFFKSSQLVQLSAIMVQSCLISGAKLQHTAAGLQIKNTNFLSYLITSRYKYESFSNDTLTKTEEHNQNFAASFQGKFDVKSCLVWAAVDGEKRLAAECRQGLHVCVGFYLKILLCHLHSQSKACSLETPTAYKNKTFSY